MSRLNDYRKRQRDAGLVRMEFWLTPEALRRLGEMRAETNNTMSETLNRILTHEHPQPLPVVQER